MSEQNILDKSMRSVFVGNIPYEATEEKLKDIFNEVGPVISFKLVYDRETGKPKGYGFCEYKDQETALSAMRNLNCYEIGGRTLRVDNACTEKSRLEMQSLMLGMPTSESYYGDAVNAEKAPEVINNIVSTLSPEQLYELMKQMKDCVQNNPVEARNMFLQNPQLGYALLQAQVVMKIVEPEKALKMLYPAHKVPPVIPAPTSRPPPVPQILTHNNQWRKPNHQMVQTHSHPDWHHINRGPPPSQGLFPMQPPMPLERPHPPFMGYQRPSVMDVDNRSFGNSRPNNSFMPMPPHNMSVPPPKIFEHPQMMQPAQPQAQHSSQADDEKAALIMQVLQLTDAQIAMLPAEQRQSIMQLKEKITLSSLRK